MLALKVHHRILAYIAPPYDETNGMTRKAGRAGPRSAGFGIRSPGAVTNGSCAGVHSICERGPVIGFRASGVKSRSG
jgi:hypothetical protein